MDLSAIGNAISNMLGGMGPYLLALLLLAGPTTCLFLYRLVTTRRRVNAAYGELDLYWKCLVCNSMNRDADSACYRCRTTRGVLVGGVPTTLRTTLAAASPPPQPVMAQQQSASPEAAPPRAAVLEPDPTPLPSGMTTLSESEPLATRPVTVPETVPSEPEDDGQVGVPVMDGADLVGRPMRSSSPPRKPSPTWVGDGPSATDERTTRTSRRR